MNDFIAIDVETANNAPSSICAIGAVKVSGGCIVDRFYELVKPEPEWYNRIFSNMMCPEGWSTSCLWPITRLLMKSACGLHIVCMA